MSGPNQIKGPRETYQIQHRYFHHTLVKVGGSVLDDLDSHHLLRLQILTFDDLSESTLAEDIENEVTVPVTCQLTGSSETSKRGSILVPSLVRPQYIVHIENIVAVFVVVSIVLHPLARFGQDTARIPRRLVLEIGIAYSVGGGKMHGKGLEGLPHE